MMKMKIVKVKTNAMPVMRSATGLGVLSLGARMKMNNSCNSLLKEYKLELDSIQRKYLHRASLIAKDEIERIEQEYKVSLRFISGMGTYDISLIHATGELGLTDHRGGVDPLDKYDSEFLDDLEIKGSDRNFLNSPDAENDIRKISYFIHELMCLGDNSLYI